MALRRRHSPAEQRDSLQATPFRRLPPAAPTPAPAPLPHSPASPGSSAPGTTCPAVFIRTVGGRVAGACVWCAGQGALPPRSEGAAILRRRHPSSWAPGFCRLEGRAPASPRPAPPPGGQPLDHGLFSPAEAPWCVRAGGEPLPVPGRTSRGAGGGVWGREGRPARLSPVQSRPRPAPLRCDASAKTAQTFCPGTFRRGAHRREERKAADALRGPARRGEAAGSER